MPTAGRTFLAFYIFYRAASAALSVYTNTSVCRRQNFFALFGFERPLSLSLLCPEGPSAPYFSGWGGPSGPRGGSLLATGGGLEFRLLGGVDPPLTPPQCPCMTRILVKRQAGTLDVAHFIAKKKHLLY